jgi:hypothetical protein
MHRWCVKCWGKGWRGWGKGWRGKGWRAVKKYQAFSCRAKEEKVTKKVAQLDTHHAYQRG